VIESGSDGAVECGVWIDTIPVRCDFVANNKDRLGVLIGAGEPRDEGSRRPNWSNFWVLKSPVNKTGSGFTLRPSRTASAMKSSDTTLEA